MKKIYFLLAICFLLLAAQRLLAQSSAMDSTFSFDGKLTTAIGTSDDICHALAIQSDGKIIAAGYSTIAMLNNDFSMARYNTDGSLDMSFGNNGSVITGIPGGSELGKAVVIQSDGKIVLVGSSNSNNNNDFVVLRYHANGSLDMNFGVNGMVSTDVGSIFDFANAVVIQPDGKIIAGGTCGAGGPNNDFALVRYNSDGSLDTGFGSGGIVKTDVDSSYDYVHALALQSDGKIVIAGVAILSTGEDIAIARYNTNGTLDNTFGTNGTVTFDVWGAVDDANAIVIQSDGKILVGGYADDSNANHHFAIVRVNSDGSLDGSFCGGIVTTMVGTDAIIYGMTLDWIGNILVGGMTFNGAITELAVARYHANGSLDISMDNDGIATAFVGTSYGAYAIALQSDGKMVAGGTGFGANFDFALARFKDASPVGISTLQNENDLTVFYNQVSSELQINGTQDNGEIILRDMSGKELAKRRAAGNSAVFDMHTLAKGCYLVSYLNSAKMVNVKVVVL